VTPAALEIRDLAVDFGHGASQFRAVDEVSLSVANGGALGLVGESGCGKSITLRAVMGLLPAGARVERGSVLAAGTELPLAGSGIRAARRRRVAMVFQDPSSGLNPVMRVGAQVAEAPRSVLGMSSRRARARALELLAMCGVPDPERRARAYPHQLSGGTRQRVMIAIALSAEPRILLCDEPTTALDVTIQAQILRLLHDLRQRMGLAIVFVTHSLAVVGELCDQLAVMYAGRIVETGATRQVLDRPRHPYTLGLLRSAVDLDSAAAEPVPIPGLLPDPLHRPSGCSFHPRCWLASPECTVTNVQLEVIGADRQSACLHHERLAEAISRG
jgi:oligopeptide/dipeptide ABC transporter ATP-binding protein